MSIQDYDALQGEEVLAKRTQHGKVFALGGNHFQAVTYATPIHQFDHAKQEWVEIDNTFKMPEKARQVMTQWGKTARLEPEQRKMLASEPVFKAYGVEMDVSCGIAGSEPFIVLTDAQNRRLSWGIDGAGSILPTSKDDAFQTEKALKPANLRQHRERIVRQINGAVEYTDIFPGVDLCCHLGQRFKDDIIYREKEAARPVVFNIKLDSGYDLRPNHDQSVDVLDASNEITFHMPAPFLMDAKGSFGNVEMRLEQDVNGYRMICTPDPDFMDSAVYPVILDPAVETVRQDSAIEDTYVVEGSSVNFSSDDRLHVVRSTSSGNRNIYMRVKSLPKLGSNHFITKAYMCVKPLIQPGADTRLMAREVTADWSESSITYAAQPARENDLWQDYCTVRANTSDWCQIDVTSLARKWCLGTNYGIMFEPAAEYPTEIYLHSTNNTNPPYFVVNYSSLAGLENYLSYDQQSAGRAGTGYVSLPNGNLIFAHSDTSMNGLRMPVSITHYYNSCDADKNEFGLGYGWRTSLHQTLHKENLNGEEYYVYTDGDGTEHYFEAAETSEDDDDAQADYTDMSGLSLKLSVGEGDIQISDKGGNIMKFPLISSSPDEADPATAKVLISSMHDALGNSVVIASSDNSGLRIHSVTDGAGRITRFDYAENDGLCIAIRTPWQADNSGTRFAYTNNELTGVTYEDHRTSTFTYVTVGSYHLLQSATGPEGIEVSYTYDEAETATDGLLHAVTQAITKGGELKGADTTYAYGNLLTTVTDKLSEKALRYHFNDNGNEVSVDDELGYAVYTRYDQTGDNQSAPINHATMRSRMQKVVHNLLEDSSFEHDSSVWQSSGSASFTRDQSTCQWGLVSMKITTTSADAASCHQSVALTPGKSYTLSGYAKSDAPLACMQVGYTVNGTATYLMSDPVAVGAEHGFQRISVSFTLPENASETVTAAAFCYNAPGNAWFDCLQLEEGPTCNHYNLLHNSDFAKKQESNCLPDGWSLPDVNFPNYVHVMELSEQSLNSPAFLTGKAVRLDGRYDRDIKFHQEFRAYGNAGDSFSAGGWCRCFAKNPDGDQYIHCRINVLFTGDGTNYASGGSIFWNCEEKTWQFASGSIIAPHDYIAIRFQIQYSCQINHADFTGFYLYPEQFGTEYVYDAKGNARSVKSLFGRPENADYDECDNMISHTAPGKTLASVFNYGATAEEQKKHLLQYSISPLGTKTQNTYAPATTGEGTPVPANGQPVAVTVSDSTDNTAARMKTETAYTENGNYVHIQTDARGKAITTITDAFKGTTTSVTDPNGQTVTYGYDVLRRPTLVTTTANGKEYKNTYTYQPATGYLAAVSHNTSDDPAEDVHYYFSYDALGRPHQVYVGSAHLSTNTYNSTGTLAQTTFENGGIVANEYDDWNRLTGVKYEGDLAPRYTYAYNANGQVAHVADAALNRVTQTEYDLANRPCRKKTHENGVHAYTGEVAYDPMTGNLSKFSERVGAGHVPYHTAFGYDEENRPVHLQYSNGAQVTYTYDKLGRVTHRTVNLNGTPLTTAYTYAAGRPGENSTSPLVESISQLDKTTVYGYDDCGNIRYESTAGVAVAYAYDPLGQLIRVNDPYDGTAGNGTTWEYEYDQGGNILNKRAYTYTDGAVGTPVQTVPYTYGDSNWKDKLTAYNNSYIAYDAIGNPLGDGTWTYTWAKGRQLQSMSKAGETVSFSYNSDGLRVRKTATSTGTTDYTLHGKNVVHLTNGTNSLHFYYDAQNRPAVVEFNWVPYAYVHNLQGDIIAIVDANGTKVVEYKYDAWGKPLSKTGSLASTLGTLNPFRYRGYVYDEETGLYYLNNRYYCARMCRFVNTDKYVATDYSPLCGNPFIYCRNNPSMFSDPSGELFLSALIFIGVSALVGAGTGAYIAASDGGDTGDIIEGAIEGMLTGAAAAAIGYFAPAVMIGGLKISSTIVTAGGGFLAGGLIDVGVQVGAHYIEQGTVNDFELDVDRMFETATTTAISAAVPTFEGIKESTVTAIGSTIVAAEASVLVSTGVIIRHQLKKYKMIMMEE